MIKCCNLIVTATAAAAAAAALTFSRANVSCDESLREKLWELLDALPVAQTTASKD